MLPIISNGAAVAFEAVVRVSWVKTEGISETARAKEIEGAQDASETHAPSTKSPMTSRQEVHVVEQRVD